MGQGPPSHIASKAGRLLLGASSSTRAHSSRCAVSAFRFSVTAPGDSVFQRTEDFHGLRTVADQKQDGEQPDGGAWWRISSSESPRPR